MENILTIKEVSDLTKIAPSTLYTILHYEKLPHKLIGSRVVIEKDALDKWIKENIKRDIKCTKK
jgi:excisionase family DNA binding protein